MRRSGHNDVTVLQSAYQFGEIHSGFTRWPSRQIDRDFTEFATAPGGISGGADSSTGQR
jgi:hypothetical protein